MQKLLFPQAYRVTENFVVGDIMRKALHNRKNIYCYTSFSSLFFFCFHYDTDSFVSIHVYIT